MTQEQFQAYLTDEYPLAGNSGEYADMPDDEFLAPKAVGDAVMEENPAEETNGRSN